jgi:hypothetical protein
MPVIVISQPMLFPWVGMFEQLKLADIFVYYDDVQFSKGSFTNRVQIKTDSGVKWLTVPLKGLSLGQKINEVQINYKKDWINNHIDFLMQTYKSAPYKDDVYDLVSSTYNSKDPTIDKISMKSMNVIIDYFGILNCRSDVFQSSTLNIKGESSQRVLDIVKYFKAEQYVSGLGALKYLDHELFEMNGIKVNYMDYQKKPYKQDYGQFTPFVSILDLIANLGEKGINYICSKAIYWKEFKQCTL